MESPNTHTNCHPAEAPADLSANRGWPGKPTSARDIRNLFAALGNEPDLHGYLEHLVEALIALFDAEGCTIDLIGQGQFAISKPDSQAAWIGSGEDAPHSAIQMQDVLDRLLETKSSILVSASKPQGGHGGSQVVCSPACTMLSPIVAGDAVLGVVKVVCSAEEHRFDRDNLHLLDTITLYLGQALYARRLGEVLDSRLLRLASVTEGERIKPVRVGSIPALDKVTRIVAKSFYREMTKAGFGTHQIIRAATEIISELQSTLRERCTQIDEA